MVYGLAGVLAIALLIAAFTDLRRRQIDNWLNAAIAALAGGDVKLLTALALWLRPVLFAKLLLIMALVGGLLTVGMGMWHLMRRRKDRLKIPYGVAIATAGLCVLGTTYGAGIHALAAG